ncbi:MAG: carboxymuconolactone decarboxylase family protein [Pseudomonadota bacterium]
MSTTRIVPLEAPFEAAVEQIFEQGLPPGLAPLNLFRTQAHNPRVLQRMFAGNLLDPGSIKLRERELLILRTCARCGSEYEWGVHVALFAQRAQLDEAAVAATVQPHDQQHALSAHERLLLLAVDALHDTSTIGDALWEQLAQHYSSAQLLELIALVGNYHAIAFVTNAARVELEAFAPRFPLSAHLSSLAMN